MTIEHKQPAWADRARRHEGVPIDYYWRPEEGPIEAVVIAHIQEPNRFRPGEVNDLVAIREPGKALIGAVRIRSGLQVLRALKPGTPFFIRPHSQRPAPSGRGSQWNFEILVDDAAAQNSATRDEA